MERCRSFKEYAYATRRVLCWMLMHIYLANGCKWWKSAYPTLPTQQKFTLLPSVCARLTQTAKYQVNSLRSFITSSLEHMRSVIQKTTMLLILTLVANLSNGALLKTTVALLCISHSHFRKCFPFQHSVFLVETKNWKRLMWSPLAEMVAGRGHEISRHFRWC